MAKSRKRRTAAQRRATARLIAFNRGRRKKSTRTRSSAMPRRRARRTRRASARRAVARRAPARTRSRRRRPVRGFRKVRRTLYKRNPSFKMQFKELAVGSIGLIGGEFALGAISGVTGPLAIRLAGSVPYAGSLVDLGASFALGAIAIRVLPREFGKMVALGAFTAAVRGLIGQVTNGRAAAPAPAADASVAGYFSRAGHGMAGYYRPNGLSGYIAPGMSAGYALSTGAAARTAGGFN